MDFEQWFKDHRYSDTPLCYGAAKDGFEAGQQSQQAEIDALKAKINKVLYAISQSELHGDRAIWGIQDEIKEILK